MSQFRGNNTTSRRWKPTVLVSHSFALALFSLLAQSGWGTVTPDATVSQDQSTTSTTVTTPAFSTASVNELLLAFVSTDYVSGSNTIVTGVSGGGLTWALVVRTNVQKGTAEIWRAFAPAALNNVSVTATLSQSVVTYMTVMSFTGVDPSGTDGSGAIGATASNSAASGVPGGSLVTTRNGSWVFGVGNDWDNAIARTPGAGQSLVDQYLASVGDTYWVQMQSSLTALTGTSVTINDTAPTTDRYNLSMCEILAAPSGTSTWNITGTISPAASGGGATVTLGGGASSTTTTDSSGNYAFAGLSNGSYTVTPSQPGYTFSPLSQTVTVNAANVTGVNFTATPQSSISGTISPAAIGAGATVRLSGTASGTTTVDAAGAYSFTGLPAGSYTVTPSSATATFNPPSQDVTISGSSTAVVSFTATSTGTLLFFDDFTGTALSSDWTVISRHGEYGQNETECNVPQQVAVANGELTITTAAQTATCADFNIDGTVRHAASSWPYISGDIQWTSLNFTYGTVEIRAKFPDRSTGLWPALWLLGSNCQVTNPETADVGYSTCPLLSSTNYAEVDMVECDLNNWCQLALSNPGDFPTCGFSVDTNYHVFTLTWTATAVSMAMDGKYTGCSFTSPSWTIPSTPMFLIIQTQTGGAGGAPNNSLLPAKFVVDYVKVTQP